MDYSKLEEIEIPKRSDTIYKEIESFEVYELTQCVAYEMAIRNHEFLRILKNYANTDNINLFYEKLEPFGISHLYPLHVEYHFIPKKLKKRISQINSTIHNSNKDFVKAQWTEAFGANKYETIERYNGYKYYSSTELHSNAEYKILKSEDILIDNKDLQDIEDIYEVLQKYGVVFNKWIKEEEINKILQSKNDLLTISMLRMIGIAKRRDIHRSKLQAIKAKEYQDVLLDSVIIPTHMRPRLKIPFLSLDTKIVVNMSLPKDEILKYIEHIKDDFDSNENAIKSPIEFLGEELQEAQPSKSYPKKPNAEKYADMFFIYDYVTARYKDVKQHNALQKEEYEAEIIAIKSNEDLSTKQKRDHKKAANSHYKEMKSDATLKDICYEDELTEQLDIQGEMIYKYYRIMKPYIEDMKYKELITGVQEE